MKVEFIGNMGTDLTVVNAARVSFSKHSETFNDNDAKLIKYLASHNHFTPFTHATITMRETVPIFVARQRFKHTVGFSYNEESRRYIDSNPTFFSPSKWRKKAENKKQGSTDEEVVFLRLQGFKNESVDEGYKTFLSHALILYSDMLDAGVAPEQARMVLPQSMYTTYYVTGSLAAWARAYNLRKEKDAQKEIQDLASQWNSILKALYPVSWEALTNG